MCGNVNSDTRRISDSSITTAAFLPSHRIACGLVAEFSGGGVILVTGEREPMGRFASFWSRADSASEPDVEIHLYALCWNQEHMLPHFFRHYDAIVDRYFIFDNHSTDNSLALLDAHPKVTVNDFDVDGTSFVEAAQQFNNNCWKRSRGLADWVIVCNIDEHLYHAALRRYLAACSERKISLVQPVGYEMVSQTFPTGSQPLWTQVRTGMRSSGMNKPQVFAPDSIEEINFHVGRHNADPEGFVRRPFRRSVKLLHYKYLGLAYLRDRLSELRQGLREKDIEQRWGHKYLWDEQQKDEDFLRVLRNAKQVV